MARIGELFINGKDAYTTWGVMMDTESLSLLMTPSGVKDFVSNASRRQHGSRYIIKDPKVTERKLNLTLQLVAKNEEEFFEKYDSFCEELETGYVEFRTKYQPTKVYRCVYNNCTPFTQFVREMAKFTLKITEPNPKDRNIEK